MKLFFDTETTGLPKNYKAPSSDTENWSRLVQIGYALWESGEIIHESESIIKPNGFEIPKEASDVHGITTEIALAKGKEISEVLDDFSYFLKYSDQIIGHNVQFDAKIVGAEFIRLGWKDLFEGKKLVCTMLSSVEFCALPGKYPGKPKYPKLEELYWALFHEGFQQTHTALDDVTHTIECYTALVEKGIIEQ